MNENREQDTTACSMSETDTQGNTNLCCCFVIDEKEKREDPCFQPVDDCCCCG